jgi:hypothetical protein
MARNFPNWIEAFQSYATFGEAPPKMHFWTAVSTIAGALRRKVWIDQYYFKWFPNFYVIFVAPPGVVAKTTTADVGMDLLREVPGIRFGPSVVTWQALVQAFAEGQEGFEYPPGSQTYHTMASLTISSGEFGNLLNPQDKDMVDMLVNLWDGKGFKKMTKHSGNDEVVNPWINLIACTTPAWIAGNFPEYMIGGGFTSRCVFVYTDRKEKLVPYPGLAVPKGIDDYKLALIQDLGVIAGMAGEYRLSKEALEWGSDWYAIHNTKRSSHLDDDRFGGYVARKQTHIHKLAMVLAASQSDELLITKDNLFTAAKMVTELELEMVKVFSKIGLSDESMAAARMVEFVKKRGKASYTEVYRYIHATFPTFKEFEEIVGGLVKARKFSMTQVGSEYMLAYIWEEGEKPDEPSVNVSST